MGVAVIFTATNKLSFRLLWLVAILVGYWVLLACFQTPDLDSLVISDALREQLSPEMLSATDSYSIGENMTSYIDRLLLPGRIYLEIYDPEELASTVPAVATALLGMLTNTAAKTFRRQNALMMALCGCVLLLAGEAWGLTMPINKNLWTSSFVLFVGAGAYCCCRCSIT